MTAKPYTMAARVLLVCLFTVCVYRAFTQSLVYDEALTWEHYILGPASNLFHYFDANHHFLNSLLMRIATAIFGVSEWSMRLPALLGAALYFTACYRLARIAFGDSPTMLLAVSLAALNPLILDFMVAARGYGLALALWMSAAALLLDAFTRKVFKPLSMALAGVLLGLSVTANFVFVLPAAALAGLALYFARTGSTEIEAPQEKEKDSRTRERARRKSKKPSASHRMSKPAAPPWVWLALGAGAIALLFFVFAPVDQMHAAHFYTGASSLQESLRSFAWYSLDHSGPFQDRRWTQYLVDTVAFVLAPLIVVVGLVFGIVRRNLLLLVTAGTAVFCGVATLLMHALLGTAYPSDRTGLYYLSLVVLILVALAYAWRDQARWRAASMVAYGLGCVLASYFLTEFNTRKFKVWEYDADTRRIGDYLEAHRPRGQEIVRVGGSWQLQQSLSYYAVSRNWTWVELEKTEPVVGLDFYALTPWDRTRVERAFGLKEVYQGPISGSALAVRESPVTAR